MKTLLTLAMMLLGISSNGRYLQTSDGQPFFWQGNTTWLMPQKLTREEIDTVLEASYKQGYNVVQVQVVNALPSRSAYGYLSGNEKYWEHLDYIVDEAAGKGIYVGMVCMWGSLVKKGEVDEEMAAQYGEFLAKRYKDKDNIVWIIGGDAKGDTGAEVWSALAESIKGIDDRHLMTFHPFGRTSSIGWWHNAEWLDFNMFQSGHRRYDQKRGDADDQRADIAEDNWRYVEAAWGTEPAKPILDGEPSYEDIPQGLHDVTQPRWQACDVRRYAYWSVFSGACGHTYGHNSIMQFYNGEGAGGYGADKTWKEALEAPGFTQMKHLKNLMLMFPYFERVPDQSIIFGNGERYDRAVATRGEDYMLIYTYTNAPMEINLSKISGAVKKSYWYDVQTGEITAGKTLNGSVKTVQFDGPTGPGNDHVLIVVDARSKEYQQLLGGAKKQSGGKESVLNKLPQFLRRS